MVLASLVSSLKSLRSVQATDNSSKKIVEKMYAMKRTSYLAELETKMVLALNYT